MIQARSATGAARDRMVTSTVHVTKGQMASPHRRSISAAFIGPERIRRRIRRQRRRERPVDRQFDRRRRWPVDFSRVDQVCGPIPSRAPSRATRSRSSSSSSSPPSGDGPGSFRTSACWRMSSPIRRCGSPAWTASMASCSPASASRSRRSAASSAWLRPTRGAHPTVPPDYFGGNMDTKHLTAGTKLFLPVSAPGALLLAGRGHAAQGDGEVCGTAIETSMRATLRLTVRKDLHVTAPGVPDRRTARRWPRTPGSST